MRQFSPIGITKGPVEAHEYLFVSPDREGCQGGRFVYYEAPVGETHVAFWVA